MTFFLIEFEECLLLNLILNLAFANPGITLSAKLSILILVISRFAGRKSFVPLSNLIYFNSLSIWTNAVDGLLALFG